LRKGFKIVTHYDKNNADYNSTLLAKHTVVNTD